MATPDFIGPEVHDRARQAFGREAQLKALAEELAEATAATVRAMNGKGTLAHVREELVDVHSVWLSLKHDLGTIEEWNADIQRKRAKLLTKLDTGVKRVLTFRCPKGCDELLLADGGHHDCPGAKEEGA